MSAQKPTKQQTGCWTLRDEARFINNIGTFADIQTNNPRTVETLLYRYRKALAAKRHPSTLSFSKAEALILIDKRLEEIQMQRNKA